MKYYIPTTTLNFNCILSSESVSPAGFYPVRGFGYSRWFRIPQNDQDGVVLLYTKPFTFNRPVSDLEDHPMMIEIDTDEKFPEVSEGVFACDHTIYLNSLADCIILFTEKDRNAVLALSESSLETKMVRLYRRRILVRTYEGRAPDVSNVISAPVKNDEVARDQRLNKIKGLLYGYYIGALLSATPQDIAKLKAFREIQNIFSAIVSSECRRPTEMQTKRLSELFTALRRDEPLFKELADILGDEHKVDSVLTVARKYGYSLSSIDDERLIRELTVTTVENPSLKWVGDMIDATNQNMQLSRRRIPAGSGEIISESETLLEISEKVLPDMQDRQLFLAWVNEVLLQPEYNGNVSVIKEHLSDELTVKAKDVLGEKWQEGNPVKTYMNDLRRHARGAGFDYAWDNGLLSSMAAAVIKGDNWDKLLLFMQSKGMADYRLAFAFYGTLNGFANLTRDLTDILFKEDTQYLVDVYCEFFRELHGVTVKFGNEGKSAPIRVGTVGTDGPSSFAVILKYFDGLKIPTKNGVSKESLRNGLKLAMEKFASHQDPYRLLEVLDKNYAFPYGWKKKNKPWKSLKEFVVKSFPPRTCQPELPGEGKSGCLTGLLGKAKALMMGSEMPKSCSNELS